MTSSAHTHTTTNSNTTSNTDTSTGAHLRRPGSRRPRAAAPASHRRRRPLPTLPGRTGRTGRTGPITTGLAAGSPPPSALPLLDHRSRERAIPAFGAPPGRYLCVQEGEDERLVALERPTTHIGRGLKADIRIEEHAVSRRHAIIDTRGDRAVLLDDRSANGTFLNGRPVSRSPLRDGDVVRFGRVTVRYVEPVRQRRVQPIRRRITLPIRVARYGAVEAGAG
jgi:hypothetical protein